MLRRDDLKLCVYNGHPPQLFDLSADPEELSDLSFEKPDLVSELMSELATGWDPEAIANIQARNADRTKLIRSWVEAGVPDEPIRWIDPDPQRNRYL